eukprot:Hpha_TRINITY_DN23682_c0_g1::TRINITY_DN23682_c0_g1_i1::g.57580::m.57580
MGKDDPHCTPGGIKVTDTRSSEPIGVPKRHCSVLLSPEPLPKLPVTVDTLSPPGGTPDPDDSNRSTRWSTAICTAMSSAATSPWCTGAPLPQVTGGRQSPPRQLRATVRIFRPQEASPSTSCVRTARSRTAPVSPGPSFECRCRALRAAVPWAVDLRGGLCCPSVCCLTRSRTVSICSRSSTSIFARSCRSSSFFARTSSRAMRAMRCSRSCQSCSALCFISLLSLSSLRKSSSLCENSWFSSSTSFAISASILRICRRCCSCISSCFFCARAMSSCSFSASSLSLSTLLSCMPRLSFRMSISSSRASISCSNAAFSADRSVHCRSFVRTSFVRTPSSAWDRLSVSWSLRISALSFLLSSAMDSR